LLHYGVWSRGLKGIISGILTSHKKYINVKHVDRLRYEVFTEVKIQVEVFWVLMSCSVVVGYQCFAGLCCFHLHPEVIDLKHPYVLKESI
jgi:hypothetical protein